MHNFDVRLHDIAMKKLRELDADVVLDEIPSAEDQYAVRVKLRNGEIVPCDLFV